MTTVADADRFVVEHGLEAHIAALIAEAPPLSEERRARLATIFANPGRLTEIEPATRKGPGAVTTPGPVHSPVNATPPQRGRRGQG